MHYFSVGIFIIVRGGVHTILLIRAFYIQRGMMHIRKCGHHNERKSLAHAIQHSSINKHNTTQSNAIEKVQPRTETKHKVPKASKLNL